jgi:hypothetical protein
MTLKNSPAMDDRLSHRASTTLRGAIHPSTGVIKIGWKSGLTLTIVPEMPASKDAIHRRGLESGRVRSPSDLAVTQVSVDATVGSNPAGLRTREDFAHNSPSSGTAGAARFVVETGKGGQVVPRRAGGATSAGQVSLTPEVSVKRLDGTVAEDLWRSGFPTNVGLIMLRMFGKVGRNQVFGACSLGQATVHHRPRGTQCPLNSSFDSPLPAWQRCC